MNLGRVIIWILSFGTGVFYSCTGADGTAFYVASMIIAAMGFEKEKL
jgi:hypothetical protein